MRFLSRCVLTHFGIVTFVRLDVYKRFDLLVLCRRFRWTIAEYARSGGWHYQFWRRYVAATEHPVKRMMTIRPPAKRWYKMNRLCEAQQAGCIYERGKLQYLHQAEYLRIGRRSARLLRHVEL
jgi:hypothetical protein